MYTIKQVAARTGISVPVLRAWERRYGVVRPGRTASGYRMYDEAALTRLRAMRHLVDQGWARGAAAAELGRLDDAAIATLAAAAPQPVPPTESGAVDLVARFVDAAAARDTRAVDTVLDDMLALARNFNATGRNWAQGDWDYNGTTDFNDMLLMAKNYSTSVPAFVAEDDSHKSVQGSLAEDLLA